jgi:DNA invertase Pin-like site-specific DNA recombinase
MEDRFLVGYARVSTDDQDLTLQIDALRRYGVPEERIYTEKMSGKSLNNRLLRDMLRCLRKGDRIVVWKLDRLGRSVKDMITVVEKIEAAGADLVSITEGVDTSTAMGRFFFHIIASIAELERGMISERTKAGMAARKAADPDVKWGAKHWFLDHPKRRKHIQGLYNAGEFHLVSRSAGGVMIKGMTAGALMAEANAADPDAKPVKNAESVRRWLREGAKGLEYRLKASEDDG